VPPLVLAAVAQSSKEKVAELVEFHTKITNLLHAQDIAPLSMGSNGHISECTLGCEVAGASESHWEYSIPNAISNATINLRIPLCKCHGLPCNVCQDAKHTLKTARNQLFTGACLW
jgi:hypothetical protein